MTLHFVHVPASELAPYGDGLRALERDIEYPVADGADAFRIDHGASYERFFSSMGDAHFILALEGSRVVGTVAGILREGLLRGRATPVLYAADMKVAATHRGSGLSRKMLMFAMRSMFREPNAFAWRYAYVAAMRGAKGDVTRTVRGVHPGKLVRAAAELALYFTPPEQLAALDTRGAPDPPRLENGIDLSASQPADLLQGPGLLSTAGRKDLRLRSTGGAPWPLVHLPYGPARAPSGWPHYLKACGEAMRASGTLGPACFGVDVRLRDHVSWLARSGVEAGAVCTVYALSVTFRTRGAQWLHLATSEI